jgi:integrase
LTITAKTECVRFSLRTRDPAEVKIRQGTAAAYLETIWLALRQSEAVALTYKQATALAGELYRAWANGEGREKTLAVEWDGEKMVPATVTLADEQAHFDGGLAYFAKLAASEKPEDLEKPLGKIVDRLLLAKGIARVDAGSRPLLLEAFRLALADAFAARQRNAGGGDFAPDPKAARFPEWVAPNAPKVPEPRPASLAPAKVSLKGLVEDWWREAKATGRKPSTYESYSNSMALFVAFLKHDDAGRITPEDVIGFKDRRLASNSARTGKPVSAKTVKDSDLAGLKTVFGWAVRNRKMATNPAEGVTVKLGKPKKLRSSGFTEEEAQALLTAASRHIGEREEPGTRAAKQWVPWLCAYTGARVGELAQLRKQDLRQVGEHWVITITPEAGTVKTNEAREVVLHEHLVERGFCAFAAKAAAGHLFLKPGEDGDIRGPLQGLKNRLAEFARATVTDPNVAPNHGWRHRFKTIGREADIEPGVLDAIQGHAPGSVSDRYGEVTVKKMAAAIAKLPRIPIA